MWERIGEIIRKEVLQSMRETKTRLTLFLPPLIQLLIFGYAVNLDVEHTRIAWMDMDHTPESRELGATFAASRYFEVVAYPENEQTIHELMDKSRVQAVIRVLPGFARDIERGEKAGVQILVEGTNSNTASLVSRNPTCRSWMRLRSIGFCNATRTSSIAPNRHLCGAFWRCCAHA